MNCLITGGAGFIGSHLADHLIQKGYKVKIIDNFETGKLSNLKNIKNKVLLKRINICNYEKLEKEFKNIDHVFHLAGLADIVPSINFPKDYFNANVNGTINVLEAARKHKVKKLVYAASASCYGIPKKYPIKENAKIETRYPYALTKYLGEELVLHWARIYKMFNVSLRFFNAYGPRSRTSGAYGAVFGVFLAQKLKNRPLTIVGNGKQTRDFIHVYDLVSAIEKASRFGRKGVIYNLASGKETSVYKIANIIGGKKIFIPKRPGEPDRSLANIEKAKAHLKWRPKISIEKGINTLLKDVSYWKNAPVWTPNKIKKITKNWFSLLK